MILWDAGPFTAAIHRNLQRPARSRLTQHIQLDESMIPTAQALKAADRPSL